MFQQSLVGSSPAPRRSWSFAVSLLAQTMVICLVLIGTLLYTPLLPAARFSAVFLEPPPPPPGPPPPPPPEHVAVIQPERFPSDLTQPTRIPDVVAVIIDPEEAPRISNPQPGVIGATDPGIPDGVINSIGANVPPPVKPPEVKAPVAAPPPGPINVGGDVQAARLTHRVEPVYPRMAIQTRTSGKVRLRAIIAANGSVEQLSVISGHPLLIRAAADAVAQWRYRPTVLNGKPTQVVTEIEVNFVLR